MIKKLAKDILIYTSPSILLKGISFFLIPLYTHVLTPYDYGYLDLIMMFSSFVHLSIALEITQAIPHFFTTEKEDSKKKIYASTALYFSIFVYLIFLILSLVFVNPLSSIITGEAHARPEFYLGIFSAFTLGIFLFYQNQFRWELKSKQFSALSFLTSFSTITLSFVFTIIFKFKSLGFILAGLISNSLGLIISILILRKSFRMIFDLAALRQMLRYSIPLVPSSLSVFLGMYINRYLIKELMTLEDVGIYGMASRIAQGTSLLIVGLELSLSPIIFSNLNSDSTKKDIVNAFRYFFSFFAIFFLVVSLFSRELLTLLTTREFYSASEVIPYLIASIFISKCHLFTPGIFVSKSTIKSFYANAFVAITNIILSVTLIPKLGVQGAGIATLFSQLGGFYLYYIFGQKHYSLEFEWKKYVITIASILAFILIAKPLYSISFPIICIKLGMVIIVILVMILSKIINLKEVKYLIHYLKKILSGI